MKADPIDHLGPGDPETKDVRAVESTTIFIFSGHYSGMADKTGTRNGSVPG